jgi:hypothetical protein
MGGRWGGGGGDGKAGEVHSTRVADERRQQTTALACEIAKQETQSVYTRSAQE